MVLYRRLGHSLIYLLWLGVDIAFNWTRKPVKSLEHSIETNATLQYAFVTTTLMVLPWLGHHRSLMYNIEISIYGNMTNAQRNIFLCPTHDDILSIVWHCFCVSNSRLWSILFFFLLHLFFYISSHGFIYILSRVSWNPCSKVLLS